MGAIQSKYKRRDQLSFKENSGEFKRVSYKNLNPAELIITTCRRPTAISTEFVATLIEMFPQATYFKRQNFDISEIITACSKNRNILLCKSGVKTIDALFLISLQLAQSARFKLSNLEALPRTKKYT